MAISINWGTKTISVPQNYLTALGGTSYSLDIDQFRLDLKALEDSDDGMPFDKTHNHNTTVNLGSLTLARVVEIINGYTVTFEDTGSSYSVSLVGANSNIADVTNLNRVSVRSNNAAGLIATGDGVNPWNLLSSANNASGSMGEVANAVLSLVTSLSSAISSGVHVSSINTSVLTAIADTHLDLPDGIEAGITPRQAHRALLARAMGTADGGGTTNPRFFDPSGTITRLAFTVDVNGNRYDVNADL